MLACSRRRGNPAPRFFPEPRARGRTTPVVLPNGTSPYVGTNYASRTATLDDPALRNPYAMNWNATYQYEFAPSWMLELSYQGSSGVGLLEAWNINTVPLNYLHQSHDAPERLPELSKLSALSELRRDRRLEQLRPLHAIMPARSRSKNASRGKA